MTDLTNKTGLIVGIANKRSISWAIAQAASAAGARLAVTYQGERLEENVRELSAGLTNPLILPCDVTDDAQIAEVFAAIDREFGGLDFVVHGAAFAPREELASDFHFVDTTRAGFKLSMDVSAYSLIALARGAAPLMDRRGGGSILTLTYLGSERVFQNYNVMGVAKAALEACVRYLAADLGPQGIRVNAISAGPIKTLAAAGISGIQHHPPALSGSRAAPPNSRDCRGSGGSDVSARFRRSRRHRRSADGRRRFPCHGHVTDPSRSPGHSRIHRIRRLTSQRGSADQTVEQI